MCGRSRRQSEAVSSLRAANRVSPPVRTGISTRSLPCNSPRVPTDCPLDFVPSRVYRLETRGLLTSAPASINMRTTVSLPDEAAAWIGRTPSRTELTG